MRREILSVFDNGKFLIKSFGGILIIHIYETVGIIKPGVYLLFSNKNILFEIK